MSEHTLGNSQFNSPIEMIQNLFGEILQIQKENKTPDEAITRIQEIILESSKAVENSTSPSEMIMDAKILQTGSNYVSSNVTSLNTNLTAFSESKYVNGILSYIENSNRVLPCGKEWKVMAPITYKMFRKTHPVSFLLGTFTFEPPPPSEKAKVEKKQSKRGAEIEKKVLSVESTDKEQPKEEGSDIYDHIFKWLVRHYKKNGKQPVSYFNFTLDPDSYWRTIENIFHFAFLVRDGNVKMDIVNGLPVVEPLLQKCEEADEKSVCSNQFCFTLSVEDWQDSIERFCIRTASIPPFIKESKGSFN